MLSIVDDVCRTQGPPSPLRLRRNCRRRFFFLKNTLLDVCSMHLMGVVEFDRLLLLFVDFWMSIFVFPVSGLGHANDERYRKVPGQPFCEHANCKSFAPDRDLTPSLDTTKTNVYIYMGPQD